MLFAITHVEGNLISHPSATISKPYSAAANSLNLNVFQSKKSSKARFSKLLESVTEPRHPLYHPLQIFLFASLSFAASSAFTSISSRLAVKVSVLTYTISQLITPFFIQQFQSYEDTPLVPLFAQMLQLSSSLIGAKIICHLTGDSLSFKELRQLSTMFLVSFYILRFTLLKFRQHCNKRILKTPLAYHG